EDDPTVFSLTEDFGDAPDPTYPTLLGSDGARHISGGSLYLGSMVDPESNGQPSANSDGDDMDGNDDEDGVTFVALAGTSVNDFVRGESAEIEVVATAEGLLNVWADVNADGDWDDPLE